MSDTASQYDFSYGGIDFNATRLRGCNYTAIYNGPDYLWTQVDLFLHGYINVSDGLSIGPFKNIGPVGSPSVLWRVIADHLRQPRLPLTLSMPAVTGNDGKIFEIAAKGKNQPISIDVNNGPLPLYANLSQVIGTRTAYVDFGVRIHLAEKTDAGVAKSKQVKFPPLLSNRWVTTHSLDQDWYTTITTRGRAVFRADILTAMQTQPDDYRPWLLVPIPENFHRVNVVVSQSHDATVIEYQTTDVELPNVPQNKNITRMNLVTSLHTRTPSTFQAEMANAAARSARAELTKGVVQGVTGPIKNAMEAKTPVGAGLSVFEGVANAGIDFGRTMSGLIRGQEPYEFLQIEALRRGALPQTTLSVVADAWGYPNTNMGSISGEVLKAVLTVLNQVPKISFRAGRQATMTSDLSTRHVHYEQHLLVDPEVGVSIAAVGNNNTGLNTGGFEALRILNRLPDVYERKGRKGGPDTNMSGGNDKNPSGRFLYRGTFLERMVAQALQNPSSSTLILPKSATEVKKENLKELQVKE